MGRSRFYAALAALLFTAVCAYAGAAVFRSLHTPRTVTASMSTVRESGGLRGIVLRREESISTGLFTSFTAGDGERLAAGESWAEDREALSETALFFSRSDGLEYLSPADADALSPERLGALMAAEAGRAHGPRLVYGFDWYYAAFLEGGGEPSTGPCRVQFEGFEESLEAHILSVSHEGGETALLLRLTQGGEDYLSLRRCGAKLIYSEHRGLEVPVDALRQRADGTYFVYTCSAGDVTERSVELIYSDSRRCLLRAGDGADALREGDSVLVGGDPPE